MKQFLQQRKFSNIVSAKKILGHDESRGKCSLKEIEANNVCKLSCSQYSRGRQGTGLAGTERLSKSYFHVCKLNCTLFVAGQSTIAQFNGGQILQIAFNSALHSALATLDVTIPAVLENHIFFHSKATVEEELQTTALKYYRSYSIGALKNHIVKRMLMALIALIEATSLDSLGNLFSFYIFQFENGKIFRSEEAETRICNSWAVAPST